MIRPFLGTAIVSMLFVTMMAASQAAERWTCSFPSAGSDDPLLATYVVYGNQLIEKWQTGYADSFRLIEHNQYGVVGISAIAAVESGRKTATVGFDAVSIDTRTHEVWHATAASGIPSQGNELIHGTCIAG